MSTREYITPKAGDYIVAIGPFEHMEEGDILEAHKDTTRSELVVYKNGRRLGNYWSQPVSRFRFATQDEIIANNVNGITNIKDMPENSQVNNYQVY